MRDTVSETVPICNDFLTFFSGDFGESCAKDQECAGRREGLCSGNGIHGGFAF